MERDVKGGSQLMCLYHLVSIHLRRRKKDCWKPLEAVHLSQGECSIEHVPSVSFKVFRCHISHILKSSVSLSLQTDHS